MMQEIGVLPLNGASSREEEKWGAFCDNNFSTTNMLPTFWESSESACQSSCTAEISQNKTAYTSFDVE